MIELLVLIILILWLAGGPFVPVLHGGDDLLHLVLAIVLVVIVVRLIGSTRA